MPISMTQQPQPLPLTLSETAVSAVGLTPAEAGPVAQIKSYAAAMLTLIEQHGTPSARVAASSFVTAACESAVKSLQGNRPVIPIYPQNCCGKCHKQPAVQHLPSADDTEGGALD